MAVAPPRSLVEVVRAASAGFVGTATVVDDGGTGEPPSPNPAAHPVVATVAHATALFGELPDQPVTVQGATSRPPDQRLALNEPVFPPDALRRLPYWDFARADAAHQVVVLLAEAAWVRPLLGPEDDLPATVGTVRRWTQLPAAEQVPAVLADLDGGQVSAPGYLAGFQLAWESSPEPVELVRSFLAVPNSPAAGVAGMVDELQTAAAGLAPSTFEGLADLLLAAWSNATEPEPIAAYLSWFDAFGGRTWHDNQARHAEVRRLLRREAEGEFGGANGSEWTERVRYRASTMAGE